jgi:hypothetical protein
MAHRLTKQAEADLYNIWHYLSEASGSDELADRQVDAITRRFYVLARSPEDRGMTIWGRADGAFPLAVTSSSIPSQATTYSFFASPTAVKI